MNMSHSRPTVMAMATVVIVFGALFAAIVYGSDARIIGIGNSANTFASDEQGPVLAHLIVSQDAGPEVTVEVLTGIYEAIAEKALAGDLEAAKVVFQIAALQRAKQEAESAKQAAALN